MATIFRGPLVQRIARVTAFSAILAAPAPNLLATTLQVVGGQPVTQSTVLIRAKSQAPRWDPPNLLTSTLAAPAASLPFNKYDWPNPLKKSPAIDLLTWRQDRKQYYVEIKPFGLNDWPNPFYAPRINRLQSFTGPKAPIATVAPFTQTEWPNPRQKAAAFDLRTWIEVRKQFYIEIKPFGLTNWPNPVLAKQANRLQQIDGVKTSEAAAIVAGQPVTQSTTLLRAKAQAPAWTSPNTLVFSAPTAAPFNQDDWANPPAARRLPVTSQQFIGYYVFDSTDPFYQNDWPNPQVKPFQIALRTWSQGSPQSFAPSVPFGQDEWPNPRLPRRIDYTWVQNSAQSFAPTIPFGLDDWPNPRLTRRIDYTWLQASAQSFAATAPFNQGDWPNPQAKAFAIGLRTWTQDRKQYYLEIQPFDLTEWPNPRAIPRVLDLCSTFNNLQQGTLGIPIPPNPNNQFDWPLALGKPYPISLRTWTQDRKQFYVDVLPFGLDDWPNPLPQRILRQLWTITQNAPQPQSVPNNLDEWPIPVGKPYPASFRSWTASRYRTLVEPYPDGFKPAWPNPLPIPRAIDLRTHWNNLRESTLQPPVQINAAADIIVKVLARDNVVVVLLSDDYVVIVPLDDSSTELL